MQTSTPPSPRMKYCPQQTQNVQQLPDHHKILKNVL